MTLDGELWINTGSPVAEMFAVMVTRASGKKDICSDQIFENRIEADLLIRLLSPVYPANKYVVVKIMEMQ